MQTLGEYQHKIVHRPGQQHGNAAGLSRLPYRQRKLVDKDQLNACNATNFVDSFTVRDQGTGAVTEFQARSEEEHKIEPNLVRLLVLERRWIIEQFKNT